MCNVVLLGQQQVSNPERERHKLGLTRQRRHDAGYRAAAGLADLYPGDRDALTLP